MQALRAAEDGGKSLDRNTHNIIFRLLCSERDSSRLRMEAQQPRTRILCLERFAHLACPDAACGAIFGDLFEEVVVCVEEEGKTRREVIHIHAAGDAPAHVFKPIAERECQFLRGGGACFTDVIPGDRDRIPLRHFLRAEFHRVHHKPHGRFGREDIFLLRDEFLEDVVLDGAAQLVGAQTLVSQPRQYTWPR